MRTFILVILSLVVGAGVGIVSDRTPPMSGWIETAYTDFFPSPDVFTPPLLNGFEPLSAAQLQPFSIESCFPRPAPIEITERPWLVRDYNTGGLVSRDELEASPDLSAYPGLIKIEGIRSPAGSEREHCAATRIDEHWFLTAAHCIIDLDITTAKPTYDVIAITPSDDTASDGTQVVGLSGALCHGAYGMSRGQYPNDIALFYLQDVSAFSAVEIAEIEAPALRLRTTDFTYAYISAWGKNGGTRYLQGGPVRISEVGEAILISERIGARGPNQGDSGAPLYIDFGAGPIVVGVLSQVTQDALERGDTGIYVRAKAMYDWIERTKAVCEQDGRYVC